MTNGGSSYNSKSSQTPTRQTTTSSGDRRSKGPSKADRTSRDKARERDERKEPDRAERDQRRGKDRSHGEERHDAYRSDRGSADGTPSRGKPVRNGDGNSATTRFDIGFDEGTHTVSVTPRQDRQKNRNLSEASSKASDGVPNRKSTTNGKHQTIFIYNVYIWYVCVCMSLNLKLCAKFVLA